MHAQYITDQQLKETETITPYDTNIFGPMSLEKPNVGKPVQQGRILLFNDSSVQQGAKLAYPQREIILQHFSQSQR